MKKILQFVLSIIFVCTCASFASDVPPLVRVEGREILADFERSGEYSPFFIQGVGYSPVPIGRPGMQWGGTNIFDSPEILHRDFQLLYDMHANAVRLWKADNTNNALNEFPNFMTDRTLTAADEYGLKVIPGFWIELSGWWECRGEGRVFVWDENFFDGQTGTVRETVREDILSRWESFIQQFKGRSEILFWAVGNETNLHLGDDETRVRAFYGLVNEMAQRAHTIDPDHPVAFVNGDIFVMVPDGEGGTRNIFGDELAPDLDIWGVNIYRGETFGDFFDEYALRSQKPLWISEFGLDAWHGIIDHPDGGYEDQEAQAQWVGGLWDEIIEYRDIAAGATVMAYSDEWWKPYQWLCQKPGWEEWWRPYWEFLPDGGDYACGVFNGTHDLYGIGSMDTTCDGIPDWHPPAPDAFFNEEWWGLMSVQRNLDPDGPDMMTPRLVYGVLAEKFRQNSDPSPIVTAVVPGYGAVGDLVLVQGKNFGHYYADPGFDPACDFNRDGVVDGIDTRMMMSSYGLAAGQPGFHQSADLNRDGKVDFADFTVFVKSYGKSSGETYVMFSPEESAPARVISWTDTEIQCVAPFGVGSGPVLVRTPRGISSDNVFFSIRQPVPVVTDVVPSFGFAGDHLAVTGSGFGVFDGTLNYNPSADFNQDGIVDALDYSEFSLQWGLTGQELPADLNYDGRVDERDLDLFNAALMGRRASRYFEFQGGAVARIVSWSDHEVVIEVPVRAQTGQILLVTEEGRIDAGDFIMRSVTIIGVSPSAAGAGARVEITGSGFGVYYYSGHYNPAMDFDRDGDVDYNDLSLWMVSYGTAVGDADYTPYADFNHDGKIDFADFIMFVGSYGSFRGPGFVVFGGDVEGRVVSWTPEKIICEVPFFAETGNVHVVAGGVFSNGKMFSVL